MVAHLSELAACMDQWQLGEVSADCDRQVSPGELPRTRHQQNLFDDNYTLLSSV